MGTRRNQAYQPDEPLTFGDYLGAALYLVSLAVLIAVILFGGLFLLVAW